MHTEKNERDGYLAELSEQVIGAAIEVHRKLGAGLLEHAIEECFCHELRLRGIPFQRQVEVTIEYKGLVVKSAYRIDVLVNDVLIVELKSAEKNHPVFEAQLLTYMKLSHKKLGLVLNFGLPTLKEGIIRRVF